MPKLESQNVSYVIESVFSAMLLTLMCLADAETVLYIIIQIYNLKNNRNCLAEILLYFPNSYTKIYFPRKRDEDRWYDF